MDLKPFAVKVWTGYDECQVFPSLEAYISFCKEKNWCATSAIQGVIEIFPDLSEKEVSEEDFLRRNLIKETIFDESALQMEAEIKERESKIAHDQFLDSRKGMGTITGSWFMPITAEKYILDYKKANKYQWNNKPKPRTLNGKPLSEETLRFYPNKIDIEIFCKALALKSPLFLEQRKNALCKKNVEEWVEDFAVWAGLEPKEKIYIVWCHDPIGHDGRKLIQRIYKCEKSAVAFCEKLNKGEVDGYVYSVIEQEIANPDY